MCLPNSSSCRQAPKFKSALIQQFNLQAEEQFGANVFTIGYVGNLDKMTLPEKLAYVGGTGFAIRAIQRLGLPAFEMSDGPYGTRSNAGLPSTTYAAGIGLAATWNRSLAEQVGAGIDRDVRARGVHFMLGPGVNIYRSPRNGPNFEYFSEDPYLASQIAVGCITGMQRQGVSATVKHFLSVTGAQDAPHATVTFDITNTGKTAGAEVAQFTSPRQSSCRRIRRSS